MTCLEHAPELDPAVRATVHARAGELLPPRTGGQVEELAKAGEMVLELLPAPGDLTENEAAATVRTAAQVGGARALELIARFAPDGRFRVRQEIASGWRQFDTREYADAVLSRTLLEGVQLPVHTADEVAELGRLAGVDRLHLSWNGPLPAEVTALRGLDNLVLFQNTHLTGLEPLTAFEELSSLGLYHCYELRDLGALTALPLDSLTLASLQDGLDLRPLAELPLTSLSLNFQPIGLRRVADLPAPDGLQWLGLFEAVRGVGLDGLERWSGLTGLSVSGSAQFAEFCRRPVSPALTGLQVIEAEVVARALLPHGQLERVTLGYCEAPDGLAALAGLPALSRLALYGSGSYDVSPLAPLDGLVIEIGHGAEVHGTETVPPERLVYLP